MALDPTVGAALDAATVTIRWLFFVDLDGMPIRRTTALYSRTFGGADTGDADLDGQTFTAMSAAADDEDALILEMGEIENAGGGSDTFTLTLSGLLLPDNDLLNIMGDKSKWSRRKLRAWWYIENPDGSILAGKVMNRHKGRMVQFDIIADADRQAIVVSSETYLAIMTGSSGRTWGQQKEYDPGDTSPEATFAAANGIYHQTVKGALLPPGYSDVIWRGLSRI